MSVETVSEDARLVLKNWLKQVGFTRGNPFGSNEADREAFLPEYFVDTGHYDALRGDPAHPRTTIVFAPRGGGKSALRVMLSSQCRPTALKSDVLAITYTDFDPIIEAAGNDTSRVTAKHHIHRILKHGAEALWATLVRDEELAARFPPEACSRFKWLCSTYHPGLLAPPAIKRQLESLIDKWEGSLVWSSFQIAVRDRQLSELLQDHAHRNHPCVQLIARVVDAQPEPVAEGVSSSLDLFNGFIELATIIGIQAVYVLIDRVDEIKVTAGSAEAMADLVEPLMANLPLMEFASCAFKFFLPHEARETLINRSTIRRDRLQLLEVVWDESSLERLLRERLLAFSGGGLKSLGPLCAGALGLGIDEELIRGADRSPRRLLRLGELLFLVHCSRPTGMTRLVQDDWDTAVAIFQQEHVPLLRPDPHKQQVYVGARTVELTGMEYKFLFFLYENKGWCDKETLASHVWEAEEGITDQAISRLARRIREKIEPDPGQPIYLITERGSGFWLKHIA